MKYAFLAERIAIAEYDGHQNATQSQRIAYQDAFIAVLSTLPYEDAEESHNGDWSGLRSKVKKLLLQFST